MRRPSPRREFLPAALTLAIAALTSPTASAQAGTPSTVIVSGSIQAQRTIDAPYAITAVDAEAIRSSGPMVNLSESMGRVPGLLVANRNNYAQDLQISSRGFGARATFGVRGLRLYTDGIPATMPDGQGQVGHFDLAGASRIEVLRGPFSVLYGNSSGGVIALFTAPPKEATGELAVDAGAFGLRQVRAAIAAPLGGGFDLKANVSAMEIDGFRPQSAADRQLGNLRLGWQSERDTVVVLANLHRQDADDPLGLTPQQYAQDPYQTTPEAISFDTRKTIDQSQLGVQWRHRFDAGALRESAVMAYGGRRAVTQYLAIPPLTQRNPALPPARWERHNGGVVDFDRDYDGVDARLRFGWTAVDLEVGAMQERQRDERRGNENFTGSPANPAQLGVIGNLRRDETDLATTRDVFAQAEWTMAPTVTMVGGLRSGRVDVEVRDRYVSGTNGDDSGSLRFDYTNPVVGLRWSIAPGWRVHASLARGFESPTLGELAYTPDNSGFNMTLKGQTSTQFEFGTKARAAAFDVDATAFYVDTDDEIGVLSNLGGRSTFQNVGRTRRYGAEFGGAWRITPALRAQAAATYLNASYRDNFTTCVAAGCPGTVPAVPVAAGNRIAGTQRLLGWAELAWRPGSVVPGEFGVEARGQSATAANDVNTVFAPGFGLFNLRWSHAWALGSAGELQTLVRLDNLADRVYVGSVIVNDGNRRFFETGAPRAWLGSLRWVSKW